MLQAQIVPSDATDCYRHSPNHMCGLILAAVFIIGPAYAESLSPAVVTVTDKSPNVLPLVEPDHANLPTRLAWSDEFSGSRLNSSKWPRNGVFRFPGQPIDTTLAAANGETERYDPSQVSLDRRNGHLVLKCEPDGGPQQEAWRRSVQAHAGKAPNADRATNRLLAVRDRCGMVHSYPNYVSTPGSLIELRVKLPTDCKGRWPAAWTFNYTYPGSANPNSGIPFAGQENDIFEGNGLGKLKITVHNELKPVPQVTVTYPSGWFTVRQWRDQANHRMYEWIDGTLVAVMPMGNLNDLTMPLMLNMAGGSASWAFIGMPDATTPRVCEMRVDYVRIYRP